jgi:hypothetical protein
MKKLLITLLASAGIMSAAEATDIISTSTLKGPQGVLIQNIINSSKTTNFVAKQTGGCGESVAIFESATKPVAIVWTNLMYSLGKKTKQNCVIDHTKAQAVMVARVSYDICVPAGFKFVKGSSLTFGNNKFNPQTDQLRDANANTMGIKFKPVTFGGSGPIVAALANKDIDVGFVATPVAKKAIEAGSIQCIFSTGSDRYGQRPMSDFLPNTDISKWNLGMMVFTRNMTSAQQNALVLELQSLNKDLAMQDMVGIKVGVTSTDTQSFFKEAKDLTDVK